MSARIFSTIALAVAATSVFAGGEIVRTETQRIHTAGPPPYPAELECRYQAIKNSSGMAWYKAPPAIPFSPCGPLAPNVRDKFGFGPFVDGFDFEPGGRLNPVTPGMVGAILTGGKVGVGVSATVPIGNPPVGSMSAGYFHQF